MNKSDAELLLAYAETGEEAAFAELVRRHLDFVYSASCRMTRDRQLAEDVTQAAFVALAHQAGKLAECKYLSGWLHRTARNIAAQTIRSEKRRRAREEQAVTMNETFGDASNLAWEEIAPRLDAALDVLPESDREALLLRYFERKSARQVAELLCISEEAAQRRVSRAMERLRGLFSREGIQLGSLALAAALSANAIKATPTSLAATISTTIASANVTSSIGGATLTKTIAMTTIQKIIMTGAVAIAMVAPLVIQHRAKLERLAQSEKLQAGTDRLAMISADNLQLSNALAAARRSQKNSDDRLGELLQLRGEVGSLRQQTNELTRLRSENRRLKVSLAAASTNANFMIAPKDSWAFAGYDDPESAFESAFWSMVHSDAVTLLASLAPDGREFQKLAGSSPDEYLKKRNEQFDKVTAFKILDKEVVSSNETILSIFLDGPKEADRFKLRRIDNQWKLDGPYRENRNGPTP